MKGSFRASMDWLHTWTGVVLGAALYMMFLAGTAAVFKEETTTWMTPELGRSADPAQALASGQARLQAIAPDARNWSITLPDGRNPSTRIAWQPRAKGEVSDDTPQKREVLDARTGQPVEARKTRGGDLFYRLHYRFEITGRNGWWLSGAAAVGMLVLLVTGVVTHKRIFIDFFTFRPRSNPQRSWIDAHVLLAVLLLPFHFMITYSGLVPIMSTVMPWGMIANYGDARPAVIQAFDQEAARRAFQAERERTPRRKPAGEPMATPALQPFLDRARLQWDGAARPGRVSVANPGDRNAVVEVSSHAEGRLSNRGERLFFEAATGKLLGASSPPKPVAQTQAVLYGLHMARFSATGLRWAYFVAGLGSTAMIASGMILWSLKRRPKRGDTPMTFGHRFVARMNVGVIVGLPIAMAGLFWANRLLPVGLADRPKAETACFFLIWAAAGVWAAIRPLKHLWTEQSIAAALAFGLLPVLNAATTNRGLLPSLAQGDWLMAGFDLTMVATGAMFAAVAWKMVRWAPAANRRKAMAPASSAA